MQRQAPCISTALITLILVQSDEDSLSYSESRNDSDELGGMKWRRRDERKLLCLQWSVLPTSRTARAAIRVDRPTSLVSVSCSYQLYVFLHSYVSCLMPCLSIYT